MMKSLAIAVLLALSVAVTSFSADLQPPQSVPPAESSLKTAPVMLDDNLLFSLRGIQAYPAEERARDVAERIRTIAADPTVKTDSIIAVESDLSTDIVADGKHIVSIFDSDAALERVKRQVMAKAYVVKLRPAIETYRYDRTSENLLKGTAYAVLATIGFIFALFLLLKLNRKLFSLLERRYKAKLHSLQIQSFEIVQAERIWTTIMGGLSTIRLIIILVMLFVYLNLVLRFFPWTRFLAAHLLDYLLTPLQKIGTAVLGNVPNLIFIGILVVVIRYLLKIIGLYFIGVEKGTIALSGFEPEWAKPTYKIVRFFIIALVAVVIYPYIPGSGSEAFKGISVFIGVVFSLGSSSAVANIIAGYTLTYRRAFRVGDRVKIGDFTGDVSEMRLQATHLRTIKNEEITVPNSVILSSHVINYSSLARERGLILHTSVTIGYDTPWRQVDAFLLMAAEKTRGILKEPKPFVLHTALNDFYVSYELNAYTNLPLEMVHIYSDLHKHILDAFNEFGVQIMSPHYRSDPAEPKVVPREQWYTPPAKPPQSKGSEGEE